MQVLAIHDDGPSDVLVLDSPTVDVLYLDDALRSEVAVLYMDDETGEVLVLDEEQEVEVLHVDVGPQGPRGYGVPAGGNPGDVLTKSPDPERDNEWTPLGNLGGDKTYTHEFTAAQYVVVQHNLGKLPAVTVIDSAGEVVEVDIDYTDNHSLIAYWNGAFSGKVICN